MHPLTSQQKLHFALQKLQRFSPSEYRSTVVTTPDICRSRSQLEDALLDFDIQYPGLCSENGIDVSGLRRSVERERLLEGGVIGLDRQSGQSGLDEVDEPGGGFETAVWAPGGGGGGIRRSLDCMGIQGSGRRHRAKERLERVGNRVRRAGSRIVEPVRGQRMGRERFEGSRVSLRSRIGEKIQAKVEHRRR